MSSARSEEVVRFPESLLTAAAHPDPYPYYAALLAYRACYDQGPLLVAIAGYAWLEAKGRRTQPSTDTP